MLHEVKTMRVDTHQPEGAGSKEAEMAARFAARIEALGPLTPASPALQARLLEEVRAVARHVDGSAEAGLPSGYDRRVLVEDPERWSLAAIILRPGQQTEAHDHDGWGCAVTVQGLERDRRLVHDTAGTLVVTGEHDHPPGSGYIFDPTDIHQPVGADPQRVTVALHFLVHRLSLFTEGAVREPPLRLGERTVQFDLITPFLYPQEDMFGKKRGDLWIKSIRKTAPRSPTTGWAMAHR